MENFRNKQDVRKSIPNIISFERVAWEKERKRESQIKKDLMIETVRKGDENPDLYKEENLTNKLNENIVNAKRALSDRKAKVQKVNEIVTAACGLVSRIIRQMRIVENFDNPD